MLQGREEYRTDTTFQLVGKCAVTGATRQEMNGAYLDHVGSQTNQVRSSAGDCIQSNLEECGDQNDLLFECGGLVSGARNPIRPTDPKTRR